MKFKPSVWLTPNTYDHNFSEPSGSGIYLLCKRTVNPNESNGYKILYVGMSSNLKKRLEGHPILLELQEKFEDVVIFFRRYKINVRRLERAFIHHFNPPFNIMGRRRGE